MRRRILDTSIISSLSPPLAKVAAEQTLGGKAGSEWSTVKACARMRSVKECFEWVEDYIEDYGEFPENDEAVRILNKKKEVVHEWDKTGKKIK